MVSDKPGEKEYRLKVTEVFIKVNEKGMFSECQKCTSAIIYEYSNGSIMNFSLFMGGYVKFTVPLLLGSWPFKQAHLLAEGSFVKCFRNSA